MRAVFDTCILLDYLAGEEEAEEVVSRADEAWISVVTWMEVMAAAEDAEEQKTIAEFLDSFDVQPLTKEIAKRANEVRAQLDVGMGEATIVATARALGADLITWSPNVVGGGSNRKKDVEAHHKSSPPPTP